jgi:uncharacterized damage-inducible protein DinB
MDVASLLLDLYGRVPPLAREAVDGLDLDQLTRSPKRGANTIAWLVWHIARVQDHYFAEYRGEDQLWVTGDWAARFGLEPDPANSGYGHTAKQVASVRPRAPEVLTGYLDAVDARARGYLEGLRARDLDRVIDRSWDPPVTLGVRLVSVADDALQHVGQAAYVRGLLGA